MDRYLQQWKCGLITIDECYVSIIQNVELDVMQELYLAEDLKMYAIENDIEW